MAGQLQTCPDDVTKIESLAPPAKRRAAAAGAAAVGVDGRAAQSSRRCFSGDDVSIGSDDCSSEDSTDRDLGNGDRDVNRATATFECTARAGVAAPAGAAGPGHEPNTAAALSAIDFRWPSRDEMKAAGLQAQVDALTSGVASWTLDNLAGMRTRAFGASAAPVVKQLQHKAISALIKSHGRGGAASVSASPPRPSPPGGPLAGSASTGASIRLSSSSNSNASAAAAAVDESTELSIAWPPTAPSPTASPQAADAAVAAAASRRAKRRQPSRLVPSVMLSWKVAPEAGPATAQAAQAAPAAGGAGAASGCHPLFGSPTSDAALRARAPAAANALRGASLSIGPSGLEADADIDFMHGLPMPMESTHRRTKHGSTKRGADDH